MKCFPLSSLLHAIGNPTVDFFSFDVEGAELPILRTLDFSKVQSPITFEDSKILKT